MSAQATTELGGCESDRGGCPTEGNGRVWMHVDDGVSGLEQGALGGAAGTQDIADHVGSNYYTAYSKLRQLEDHDLVESRKIANARLWSRVDS